MGSWRLSKQIFVPTWQWGFKKLKTIQLKQQVRIIHSAGSMVAECYHLDLTDEQ